MRFASASWGYLRWHYADFPWNDYCFHIIDPSLCVEHMTGDSVWHGGVHSSLFFSLVLGLPNLGLTACSRAINDREVAHKRYLNFPSPESHALYISARNHAKSVLQLAKKLLH